MYNIAISGASGSVGRELLREAKNYPEVSIVGVTTRTTVGQNLRNVLKDDEVPDLEISGSLEDIMMRNKVDVLIDYTSAKSVKSIVMDAIGRGVNVVVGSSGLDEQDFSEINTYAIEKKVGVIAAGNFSLTATLLQYFSKIAAKFIPSCEIVEYASDKKLDTPSGTSRDLSFELSKVKSSASAIERSREVGEIATRGGVLNGINVHAIRLPGHYFSVETSFGDVGERLSLKHECSDGRPFVKGTYLAAVNAVKNIGLIRGLERILNLGNS